MKVSIFIPVYNGEKYIGKTLDSILSQSYTNFEILCVDDSSVDNSWDVLLDYQKKDDRVKIYRKENEGNVPFSWRFILPKISGEWILYLSQDDFLENDSLEKLCRRQLETGADAVIPKTIYYYATQKNNHVQLGLNGNISPVINGCQAFMLSLDYSIPGHVLWNMDVIRANSDIPTDTFDSDDYMQRVWFYHCKKVAFSDAAYYYRQDNSDAITKKIGYYRFETLRTNLRLLDLVYKYNKVGSAEKD